MLKIDINSEKRTVFLEPEGHLSKQDFESLAQQVDPFIDRCGDLNGVLVHASKFPGWDSFAAFVEHIQFVNGHHKHIKKVALCTDSSLLGNLAEKLGAHFIAAQIKVFHYDELDQAKQWISD